MKVKTAELIEMSDEVDDILHRHGFVVDHHILTLSLMTVIRLSYPADDIEIEKSYLESLIEKG